MAEKTSAKPVAVPASPTTMAWSSPITSLWVSVKSLKESGGFGKIMEKFGLAMTESDLVYVKADATALGGIGGVFEISEDAMATGKSKFVDALTKASIEFDANDIKFRLF